MTTPEKVSPAPRPRQSARNVLVRTGIAVALGSLQAAAVAQTLTAPAPVPASDAGSGEKTPLRNGYAESLLPTARRSAGASAQPYAPIKPQNDQASIPEIEMFVGESRVFPTPKVARIAVGNGQIMNAAALDNREVVVFANGVGTSSLFIWTEDGRYQRVKVNIVPGDTTRYSREIAAFLAAIPNAKASVIGDKIIVEGDNLSDLDIAKIEELGKRYPQIVNFTNRLGWEQMVIMDVKVVEFPVNELREIGLKWAAAGGVATGAIWSPLRRGDNANYQINLPGTNPPPISTGGGGPVNLPSGLNVLSLINLGLNAQLNLLAQNGSASILAEPQLSARNGAKASFLAGGEYPYTVSTINGPTVVFKPYGIKLDILPRVDRNGVIRATIESEVSSLDPSVATAAGPAILSRKTNTEFNVRSGETMVLSGLLSRKTSTNIDKVPLLGDIPVLGALFRSKRFQNDETELVVFVTPTVVDSRSAGLVDRVQKTTERLQQDLGRQPFLSNPLQPDRDASRFNEPAMSGAAAPVVVPAAMVQPVVAQVAQVGPALPVLSADQGSTLLIVRDGITLRAAPTSASAVLVELPRGAAVRMTTVTPERSGAVAWRHVRVGELQGWIAESAAVQARLEPAPPPTSPPTLPTRRGAAAQEALIGGGRMVQSVTANAAAGDAPLAQLRVGARQLALRVSPDINAPTVVLLRGGDLVDALPQPPQGYWLPVQVDGKRGWAPAQWLVPVL